jgi:uncharacterized integral membrane protein
MKNVPWRLLLLLALLVVVAVFAGFNLDRVNVSVGFYVFEDIPLFLALIVAFIAGSLLMLPFGLRRGKEQEPQAKAKNTRNELEEEQGR